MYDQRDDDGDNDDMVTFFVRALYDYQSADASSLSFRRGALIEVLTQLESGWWDGLLDGERGWFPSNYVVQVSDQEVEQELATRITNHNDDMSQQTHWNEDGLEYNQSDQSVARADDYWMPQVTAGGQIFYMNTRTGQVSSEIPQTVDPLEEYVQPSPSSSQPTQHPPPQSNNNNFVRARSDTRDTYSSTVSGFSEATTAPPSAGFGLITRSDQIPEPWVKRLADDGLSYFYVNKETGAVRWSPPSPIDLKEPQKLPVEALELDDTEWTLNDAADWGLDNASSTHGTVIVTNDTRPSPSLKETIASQTSSKPPERYRTHLSAPSDDVRRASVYSDDSEVNPFGRSSPPLRSPPATRPNGNHPTEPLHSQTPGTGEGSQPIPQVTVRRTKSTTAVAAPPPISAESLARRLQARLLPPPPETVDSLSSIAREAISAVVEAVGQQPADSNDPSAEQPTIMAVRVAAVVTAVRNLLYVSGTLSTPVSSLYLSRHSIDDVIESGRTPLMELKPFQRKVTATLSKLVLSARAAASNPDWPYDDAATRVDNDASELERAVMSFVMEVGRMEVLGSMVNEKRLRGVLISADGSNGVGMGVYGAGFAGMWKGAGFVRPEDGDHGPQWTLGSDMLRELSGLEALAEESLALLLENTSVEKEALIPLVRMALVNLTAYLAAVEDCDIARTIDVDGFQPGDQQGAPELVAEYAEQVELARRLIRSLEASKQAVYDDGSCVWTAAQACYAESITGDGEQLVSLETLRKREETLLALGLDIPSGWPSHMSLIYAAVTSLRESLKDIMKSLESLLDVGIRQEEAASQGVHGSVGHRDGQVGRQRGMAGANNNNNLHHGLHHQGGLGMNLDFGFDDQEEEEDGEDGGEGMVDVGFALGGGGVVGGGKKRSSYLPSRRPPPQSGHPGRPGLPHLATSASVPLLDPIAEGSGNGSMPRSQSHLGHASSLSMGSIGGTEITAGSTLRESLDEGGDRSSKAESKTSTIREGTYANGNKQENGKDEEYHSSDDDDLGIPAPKVAKSPARTTKVEKFFGDDTPAHYIASHNANQAAWYLRNESTDKEILINPDGGVRGGTLPALVERLTLHNYRDAVYIDTFLTTFKSFATVDEVFDILVARYNIREPEGLSKEQHEEWVKLKQSPIRLRVINILRQMLMETYVLEKEDFHILPRIREFAASVVHITPPAKQLIVLVDRVQSGDIGRHITVTSPIPPPPSIPPRNPRRIKLLEVEPLEMARQLTIMENRLYNKIRPIEFLQRAKEQGSEDDSIKTIISTSNRLASWVADSVLKKEDPKKRALVLKNFILVADRCRYLQNFSTMAALIAGLNSPPIRRLKRTWEQVNTRIVALLDDLEKTLDSARNFTGYRAMLSRLEPPCVPFLGVYLTLLTFIQDGSKDLLVKEGNLINFNKRQKAAEVIREIKRYQSKPYNLSPLPTVLEYIDESLVALENAPDFWELSMRLEPREREEEKMARLLQESGFL